jgi:hypothetical protein
VVERGLLDLRVADLGDRAGRDVVAATGGDEQERRERGEYDGDSEGSRHGSVHPSESLLLGTRV